MRRGEGRETEMVNLEILLSILAHTRLKHAGMFAVEFGRKVQAAQLLLFELVCFVTNTNGASRGWVNLLLILFKDSLHLGNISCV